MVRLGSNFFDAYNNEIDTLRSRRKQNADAFNAFVELKQQNGEKVTAQELERYKQTLSGGDFYFAQGLPSSTSIAETARRTTQMQQHKAATEAGQRQATALRNSMSQLNMVKEVAGLTIGMSDEQRAEAMPQLFAGIGAEGLYEQYRSIIPNIASMNEQAALLQWVQANNFDSFTTTEGMETALALAPAWARERLAARGRANVGRHDQTLLNDAITATVAALPGMVESVGTGGDERLRTAIRGHISSILATRPDLIDDTIINSIMNQGRASSALYLDQRTREAIAGYDISDTSILGANGDDAQLRNLARIEAQTQWGGSDYPPELANGIYTDLRSRNDTLINQRNNTRIDTAVLSVNSVDRSFLDNLDTEADINAFAEKLLTDQQIDLSSMDETARAAAMARVKAALVPLIEIANDDEALAATQSFYTAITNQNGQVLSTIGVGNLADEEQTIFNLINDERSAAGLTPYTSMDEWRSSRGIGSYEWYTTHARTSARARYAAQVQTATQTVTASVESIIANQLNQLEPMLETLKGSSGDIAVNILQELGTNYLIPPSDRQLVIATIETLVAQEEPTTVAEAQALVSRIVDAHGLLPNAIARTVMIERELSDRDLIEPGTLATDWYAREERQLRAVINPAIAAINNMPQDTDPAIIEAERQKIIEALDEWRIAVFGEPDGDGGFVGGDFQDADIQYNLDGLSNNRAVISEMGSATITEVQRLVNQARPTGKPSFLFGQRGDLEGYFAVAPEQAIIAAQNGFDPNFLYQRNANGEFVRTDRRAAPPVSEQTGGLDLSAAGDIVTQQNPNASPLVNDIRGIIGESELNALPGQMAAKVATGGDGGPASSPFMIGFEYIFGSADEVQKRIIRQRLSDFLYSDEAVRALRNDPGSAALLKENPTEWAILHGLQDYEP